MRWSACQSSDTGSIHGTKNMMKDLANVMEDRVNPVEICRSTEDPRVLVEAMKVMGHSR